MDNYGLAIEKKRGHAKSARFSGKLAYRVTFRCILANRASFRGKLANRVTFRLKLANCATL